MYCVTAFVIVDTLKDISIFLCTDSVFYQSGNCPVIDSMQAGCWSRIGFQRKMKISRRKFRSQSFIIIIHHHRHAVKLSIGILSPSFGLNFRPYKQNCTDWYKWWCFWLAPEVYPVHMLTRAPVLFWKVFWGLMLFKQM